MYKATEINNNASDFKVGDTVRFYVPTLVFNFQDKLASYYVGTGVITKAYISKETEAGHFGRGAVKGVSFGKIVFEVATDDKLAMDKCGAVSSYRPWKQTVSVVMGMPFGGIAK